MIHFILTFSFCPLVSHESTARAYQGFCVTKELHQAQSQCERNQIEIACQKGMAFPERHVNLQGLPCLIWNKFPFKRFNETKVRTELGSLDSDKCASNFGESAPGCTIMSPYDGFSPRHSRCFKDCVKKTACLIDQGNRACIAALPKCPESKISRINERFKSKEELDCIPWNQVKNYENYGVQNTCIMPEKDPGGPWCFVKNKTGNPERKYCYGFCENLTCPALKLPTQIQVLNAPDLPPHDSRIPSGSNITLSCRQKWTDTVNCLENGTWDKPACQESKLYLVTPVFWGVFAFSVAALCVMSLVLILTIYFCQSREDEPTSTQKGSKVLAEDDSYDYEGVQHVPFTTAQ